MSQSTNARRKVPHRLTPCLRSPKATPLALRVLMTVVIRASSSRTSPAARAHSFWRRISELTPYERLRNTDKFDDPNVAGEMQVTINLKKVSCGTKLSICAGRIPAAHSTGDRVYLGWQESLHPPGEARRSRDPRIRIGHDSDYCGDIVTNTKLGTRSASVLSAVNLIRHRRMKLILLSGQSEFS